MRRVLSVRSERALTWPDQVSAHDVRTAVSTMHRGTNASALAGEGHQKVVRATAAGECQGSYGVGNPLMGILVQPPPTT